MKEKTLSQLYNDYKRYRREAEKVKAQIDAEPDANKRTALLYKRGDADNAASDALLELEDALVVSYDMSSKDAHHLVVGSVSDTSLRARLRKMMKDVDEENISYTVLPWTGVSSLPTQSQLNRGFRR